MENWQENLKQLQQINRETATSEEIRALLDNIGHIPVIITTYYPEKKIIRGVNIGKEQENFTDLGRISFKPAHLNKDYGRASTPDQTMFYGVPIERIIVTEDGRTFDKGPTLAKATAISEINQLLRNPQAPPDDAYVIASTWRVIEPINLLTVFDPSKDYTHDYVNEIKNHLITKIQEAADDIHQKGLAYYEFLGKEYGKYVDPTPNAGKEYEYKISGEFSRMQCTNLDGVLYPSVRADGIGLCVAIKPESIHKLEPLEVGKFLVSKKEGLRITTEGRGIIEPNATKFEILPRDEFNRRYIK